MAFLSKAVFAHRMEALRALMDARDLDAVAVLGADFFQFYSNFHVDVQTWERPIVLVLPRAGAAFAVMNALSSNHYRMARERGAIWVEDVTFYFEHPASRNDAPLIGALASLIAESLDARGLGGARIGYDAGPGPLGAAGERLDGVSLHPITAELRRLRWVKHPEELALMRQAADISDWLQDRYRENIRPGRLVQELDLAMTALGVEEGARRFPGENLEWRVYSLSGPASASPHGNGAQTGARIAEGDVLVNIVIPRLNGVTIENERTWCCGRPDETQVKAFEAARGANEAAIEQIVTGAPVSGIDAAARQVFEAAGLDRHIIHRTGHGVGLIGHEFPEDMAFNDRPLLEREVYSAEPGIYLYGIGGFRFDDTVVVGETPEVLTKAPKDLKRQTIA